MSYPSFPRTQRQGASARDRSSSSSNSSSRPQNSQSTRRAIEALARDPSPPYVSPYAPLTQSNQHLTVPDPWQTSTTFQLSSSRESRAAPMSVFSSSSDHGSSYSSPGPQDYQVVTASMMSDPRNLSATNKTLLLRSLNAHSINTLPELRRIERIFAALNAPDTKQPMKAAWVYYVNYHNLLNELRGMTRQYPFSSECLDDAKKRVSQGGGTSQGNLCWQVLMKVKEANLIPHYARLLAAKPAMWGGRAPSSTEIEKLATACTTEWTRALGTLLRHWNANGQ